MSKVQYYCASSLDGFIATVDDSLDWLTGYEGSYEGADAEPGPMSDGGAYEMFYEGVGALISGSTTYGWVLDHLGESEWPYRGKPYWVLSAREVRIPAGEGFDVRVHHGPVTEVYEEMSAAAGARNLWIVGGGSVASQFADAGLLDELILTIVPVALGAGKPLFARPGAPMRLAGVRAFENGMVELRYAIER